MLKACLGCHRVFSPAELRESRCISCRQAGWRERNNRRSPVARATYASPQYREARRLVLAGATHCAWCKRPVSEVGPLTAGHVRSIEEAPGLAADPSNLAPSCRSCQEREKQQRIRRLSEANRQKLEGLA
jgi:5-methylcytosine-specific restriction endonuclease McrA